MVLFCLACHDKATHTYPKSNFPMYCSTHKRQGMITFKPKSRRPRAYRPPRIIAKRSKCMICDLDFSVNTTCSRCQAVDNKAEKLVIKYLQQHLPSTGLSLNSGDHITVIKANYIGNTRIKLLDLEVLFNTNKIILLNFIFDINKPELLEDYLRKSLEVVKSSIEKKITKSEIIQVD